MLATDGRALGEARRSEVDLDVVPRLLDRRPRAGRPRRRLGDGEDALGDLPCRRELSASRGTVSTLRARLPSGLRTRRRGSLILTTNLPFGGWTKAFPDARLTNAVDRVTHRAHIIETGSES